MPSTPYHCIAVRSATEQYDIHIGPGVLTHVGEQAQALTPGRKAFVFSHPHLYKLYGVTLADNLRAAGFDVEARRGQSGRATSAAGFQGVLAHR